MIPQQSVDQIKDLDIVDVIEKYVELKKKGSAWLGCCPFHNENTPSFSVNPAKGIYNCFGCGKSGDGIHFVQEFKSIGFIEAVRMISGDHGIIIEEVVADSKEQERYKHIDALNVVNQLVCTWFENNLKQSQPALDYVSGRWNEESISQWHIGYAPAGWDNLMEWSKSQGIKIEILIEAGLIAESKGKFFDYFRDRIIFPIFNHLGRIVGFTGRDFSGEKDAPKYFNTKETPAYVKGKLLYGMNFSRRPVKEQGFIHLVEGNPDVIRLHQLGKSNTVGTCGTSLTRHQVEEIHKVCKSVTIIGDGDKAGQKAMASSGEMIIRAGMYCNIVPLPTTDGKVDPDSFFTEAEQFEKYSEENLQDYIFWKAGENLQKAQNPDIKAKLISEIAELIDCLPDSSHSLYIEQLSKEIKPKKAWVDAITSIKQLKAPKHEKSGSTIPKSVSQNDYEKYGFYEDQNCYHFRTNKGLIRGTNFKMEPFYHLSSILNAKRIYRITNEFGFTQVIELAQRDLISLAAFKLRVESLGNFLFEATEYELVKLKRFLYEKTDTAFEVVQLGWQKDNFWAWCDGIYNGSFIKSDVNGIVRNENKNYYLPASSNIYKAEDNLFVSERRFKFLPGAISLHDHALKLINVYGDNAIFGLCFYFASLFRDIIVKKFQFFPILNLFGPKGAGKTELAISLLQFFGNQAKGINMTNTTKPAMADHVGMFSNALCHIDEYRNDIEFEKVEFLKGLWDGTGRTRMNMDKDRKKETSAVDVGIMLSGQQMPTADIALFSRLVFLTFSKYEYSDQEQANFNDLKDVEKKGLCHITHSLLKHREYFAGNFLSNYMAAVDEVKNQLDHVQIEDRIFRNWMIIISAYRTIREFVNVPWEYEAFIEQAAQMIIRQNSEIKKSNELSVFWGIVEFLAADGLIKEEVDFKMDFATELKTDLVNRVFPTGKNLIYIYHTRLFQLYRVHGQRSKENILPIKTLEYYLTHSREYYGKKTVAFSVEEAGKIVEDCEDITGQSSGKRKVTTAMVFDYELLNISLSNSIQDVVRAGVFGSRCKA